MITFVLIISKNCTINYKKLSHDGTGCGITGQSIRMGYDEIWLIGIDNQYIWKKDWVRRLNETDNRVEFIQM